MSFKNRLLKIESSHSNLVREPMAIFITLIEAIEGKPQPVKVLGWRNTNSQGDEIKVMRLAGESDAELQERAEALAFKSNPDSLAVTLYPIIASDESE
jgi:limonene-1,2-epoxide hydrolase